MATGRRAFLMASILSAMPAAATVELVAPQAGPKDPATPGREDWKPFWPIRSCDAGADGKTDAQRFFNSHTTSVADVFAFSAWNDRATFYAEAVRDTGLCSALLVLGVAVSKADAGSGAATAEPSVTQKEAVQRLVTSGGSLMVKAVAPALYLLKSSRDNNTWAGFFLAPRLALDGPTVARTSDFAGVADLGAEAQGSYTTDGGVFTFFGLARVAYLMGTRNWADNLASAHRQFWVTEGMVGISVAQYASASVTFLIDAPQAVRKGFPGAMLTFTTGPKLAEWKAGESAKARPVKDAEKEAADKAAKDRAKAAADRAAGQKL